MMDLTNKVALITGGASGIGKSFAEEFLENGIKGITIADINDKLGKTTTKSLEERSGSEKILFVKTDVTDEESFKNAFEKTLEKYGNIDILVNNAGVFDEINWKTVIQVNLVGSTTGTILAIEHYLPKYKSSDKAYIINISSVSGFTPVPFCPVYSATKHGLVGLTRSYGANRLVRNDGVCVLAVCPSATDTPMSEYNPNITKYQGIYDEIYKQFGTQMQSASAVAKAGIEAMQHGDSGSVWSVVHGELRKINFPNENFTDLL